MRRRYGEDDLESLYWESLEELFESNDANITTDHTAARANKGATTSGFAEALLLNQ